MFDDVETTKISPPIEIDGDNLDLDEEGWASLMEQIYTAAEKNGVDPQSITKLVSLSGANSQGSNTGIDMDALFAEAAKHGIDPQSITKVIELGTGTVEESLGGEENMGSNVMDEVIREAEKQGVDPNSITKTVEIDESELMAKGGENIDPSVRDAVIEGAVRQGIDPNTITKITEKGVDDIDASVRDAVYEEARKQGIDPSTITKIVDVEESTGDIEANGENLGAQGNVDSSLMDQVYEEARKQGVDPSTITEVIDLTEDSEGHLVLPSGLADVQHKVDLDAVIKAAEKKGIDPSTISKIVELKGAADGASMPDGGMANANGMIASNRQSMLDAVYKAAQERNIPLDTITKVIDISEDPSETDVDAFQQAGINLVGKSKLSSEDFEVIKSAEGLESDIRVAMDGVIPTDGDNENTPAVLNEGEDDELPDAKPITDGVDQ